jgi:hypothetical protein
MIKLKLSKFFCGILPTHGGYYVLGNEDFGIYFGLKKSNFILMNKITVCV